MKPDDSIAGTPPAAETEYEAPCVETVVTSDEVDREANYGGISMM